MMEMNAQKEAELREEVRLVIKTGQSWLSNKSSKGSDLVKCSEAEKAAYLYGAQVLLEEQRKNEEIEEASITAERMLFLADSPAICSYTAEMLSSCIWLMKLPYLNAGRFSLKKMPGEFHREALNFVHLERKFPRFLPVLILIAAVLVGIAGAALLTLPDVAAGLAGEDGMNVLYAVIMLVMAVSCLCLGIWWGGGITVAAGAGIVFLGSKIPLELLRRFSPSAALLIAVVILIMVYRYMRNQEKKLAHLCEYAERVLKYGETLLANLLKGVPAITDLDTPFSDDELFSGEEKVKYMELEALRLYGEAIDREMRDIRNRLKKLGK